MDEKNCVAGFFVKLNPEAIAKLPLSESELWSLVRSYRYFSFEKAAETLFCFNYGTKSQKKEAISCFRQKHYPEENAIFQDSQDEMSLYSEEDFRTLSNELYLQYKANHPDFLSIDSIADIPNNCQEELLALKEKMKEHPVLLFKAVEQCVWAHKKDILVSRCVLQLLSNSTTDDTIALKSMGFHFQYRIQLLPFAKEIGMLLLAMHKSYLKKQQLLTVQDCFILPLIELLKQMKIIQSNGLNESIDSLDEISFYETEVLNFIEIFSSLNSQDSCLDNVFLVYKQKLENLGQSILSLLNARIAFSSINSKLIQFNSAFSGQRNDSILLAAAINITLAKNLLDIKENYSAATTKYYSVYEDLCRFVDLFKKTP